MCTSATVGVRQRARLTVSCWRVPSRTVSNAAAKCRLIARRRSKRLPLVSTRLPSDVNSLELAIANPVGHPSPRPGGGRGLIGMRERAELLGGMLSAERDGDLFLVVASLPYVRERA